MNGKLGKKKKHPEDDGRPPPRLKTVLFIRNLPKDMVMHFKAYCARRGRTMTYQIKWMIKEVLSRARDGPT